MQNRQKPCSRRVAPTSGEAPQRGQATLSEEYQSRSEAATNLQIPHGNWKVAWYTRRVLIFLSAWTRTSSRKRRYIATARHFSWLLRRNCYASPCQSQPPSSRFSLAQAVVSANTRFKATSLGLDSLQEQAPGTWPTVKVMDRPVPVLKRSGYEWKQGHGSDPRPEPMLADTPSGDRCPTAATWHSSSEVTSRSSTFVAHCIQATKGSSPSRLLESLFSSQPRLREASHNSWAIRVDGGTGNWAGLASTSSFDDGESGCGEFLLKFLRETGSSNVMVVVTRWFGGILLGPSRWAFMRKCLHEVLPRISMKPVGEIVLGGEAVWALDCERMKNPGSAAGSPYQVNSMDQSVPGVTIHTPGSARSYLLKSFATHAAESTEATEKNTGTQARQSAQKLQDNLALLLGALRIVFESWAGHTSPSVLDSKAWSWYVQVRPAVESGPAGWGAKGALSLQSILDLRRTTGGVNPGTRPRNT